MEQIILVIHLLVALAIIGLILLQQGKGAEAGASFGSGASQTVFGSQGSGNFFTRATAALATIFFITSFGLAILAKQQADVRITDGIPVVESEAAIPAVVELSGSEREGDVPAADTSSAPSTINESDVPQ